MTTGRRKMSLSLLYRRGFCPTIGFFDRPVASVSPYSDGSTSKVSPMVAIKAK